MAGGISAWSATDASPASRDQGLLPISAAISCILAFSPDVPAEKFSMNVLWDKAISEGRLHGIAHSGKWFHVGTPDAIGLAEAELAKT